MDAEAIKTTIQEFLTRLSVPVTSIAVEKQGDLVVFNVQTPESGMIIGREGEHLKALNYIVGHMISNKAGYYIKFNIDVNGYRQTEMNNLMTEARKVAEEVRKTKAEKELRPMTSYERMVIHNMFTDDAQIETGSVGEGVERRVVIKYIQI